MIRRLVNLGVWIWWSYSRSPLFISNFYFRPLGSMGETVTCYPFSAQCCAVVIIDKDASLIILFWIYVELVGDLVGFCAFFMCCILLAYLLFRDFVWEERFLFLSLYASWEYLHWKMNWVGLVGYLLLWISLAQGIIAFCSSLSYEFLFYFIFGSTVFW